jgi:hypothetical protein
MFALVTTLLVFTVLPRLPLEIRYPLWKAHIGSLPQELVAVGMMKDSAKTLVLLKGKTLKEVEGRVGTLLDVSAADPFRAARYTSTSGGDKVYFISRKDSWGSGVMLIFKNGKVHDVQFIREG